MNQQALSRKNFLRNSSLLLAGSSFLFVPGASGGATISSEPAAAHESIASPGAGDFILKNVLLETGFEYDGDAAVATKTGRFNLRISGGKISAVLPYDATAKGIDAGGLLALPSFRDMHIHLDKTYYGGPWKSRLKSRRSVKDMIALEQEIIPGLLKTSTYRAGKLIELLQSKGTAFARSHVNIEPTSGLRSLENLQRALENKKDGFGAELVIFPQHGLYYTASTSLMKEAAQMDIDFIGGLDPQSIDGNIERSIDFTVQLALDHGRGIDIHLHEGGESGLRTVEYLADKVLENPVLKGKTWLSHCFVLAQLDSNKQEAIAEKLAAAGIGIASTIPIGNTIMPIPLLYRKGVEVVTGNDSIIDHWNTFGTGSVLQKANLAAQLYGYVTEFDLSRILRLATGNILPLDDTGNRQWPKAGDAASLVLVDASCSAEAVSRVSPVRSLFHKGKQVF